MIFLGIFLKLIPFAVWALGIAKSAAISVTALPVKINAVAAGMGKNPVQNNGDPRLVRGIAQTLEILLRAQQRVDFLIVGRIVAVIGMGLKNRVEI